MLYPHIESEGLGAQPPNTLLGWEGGKKEVRVLPIDTLGGAGGTRTPDLLRAREALSQLSYSPILPKYYSNKGSYPQFAQMRLFNNLTLSPLVRIQQPPGGY